MDLVIIVLGVMFLCGAPVGKALAICSIIEGILVCFNTLYKTWKDKN